MQTEKYDVIFTLLDGTIVTDLNNGTAPRGIWDMKLNFKAIYSLIQYRPKYIFVVSNQERIEHGSLNKRNFEFKMEYIIRSIKEYMNSCGFYPILVEYSYCPFLVSERFRLPGTGMLDSCIRRWVKDIDNPRCAVFADVIDKCADDTAKNFGCDRIHY